MPLEPVESPGKVLYNADSTAANGDLILITMFLDSARSGCLEAVQSFVVGDVSVNIAGDGGWTALHHAAYGGHLAVVEYLVEHGADVNAKSNDGATALHWAVVGGGGDLAGVQYLVEHGADVTATLQRRLYCSGRGGVGGLYGGGGVFEV